MNSTCVPYSRVNGRYMVCNLQKYKILTYYIHRNKRLISTRISYCCNHLLNRQLYLTLLLQFLVDLKLYNLLILYIIIVCILCLERAALSFLAKTNSVGTAEDVNVLGYFRPHNSLAGSKQSGVKCALQTNEWLA